jgi:hypothetical protein
MRALEIIHKYVMGKTEKLLNTRKYGLVADSWTGPDGLHYHGLYAVQQDGQRCKYTFLKLLIQEDESSFSSDLLYKAIRDCLINDYTQAPLGRYAVNNLLFLVSDHASVVQAAAEFLQVPFIGCASHRLNLGCCLIHSQHKDILRVITNIAVILRTSIRYTSVLWGLIALRVVLLNKTRWSSTHAMCERFLQLKPHLPLLLDKFNQLPLRAKKPKQHERLTTLLRQTDAAFMNELEQLTARWTDLSTVRMELQHAQMPLVTSLSYFQTLHESDNFPEAYIYFHNAHYIAHSINNARSRDFYNAIVKLDRSPDAELTEREQYAVETLKTAEVEVEVVAVADEAHNPAPPPLTALQMALLNIKKVNSARVSASPPTTRNPYMDVHWIPCSSNIVERLWSKLKILLGTQRQRLSRFHLQMFANLIENLPLWENDEDGCAQALMEADNLRHAAGPAAAGAGQDAEEVVGVPYVGEIDEDEDEDELMDDEIEAIVEGILEPLANPVEEDPQIGDRREREEPRRGARARVPNRFYDLP